MDVSDSAMRSPRTIWVPRSAQSISSAYENRSPPIENETRRDRVERDLDIGDRRGRERWQCARFERSSPHDFSFDRFERRVQRSDALLKRAIWIARSLDRFDFVFDRLDTLEQPIRPVDPR